MAFTIQFSSNHGLEHFQQIQEKNTFIKFSASKLSANSEVRHIHQVQDIFIQSTTSTLSNFFQLYFLWRYFLIFCFESPDCWLFHHRQCQTLRKPPWFKIIRTIHYHWTNIYFIHSKYFKIQNQYDLSKVKKFHHSYLCAILW